MTWEPTTDPYFGDHHHEERDDCEHCDGSGYWRGEPCGHCTSTLAFMVEETIAELGCGHETETVSPVTGGPSCAKCAENDVRDHGAWLNRRVG